MKPKITISVRIENCTKKQIISWVELVIGPLEIFEEIPDTTFYEHLNENRSVLVLTEWGFQCFDANFFFSSEMTPWETVVDCARDAVRRINGSITVYCDPNESVHDVDPLSDTMLKIDHRSETLFIPKTED